MKHRKRYPSRQEVLAAALLMLVLLGVMANAQVYVFNGTKFATGDKPQSVKIADFNKDGNQDLAIANFNDNTVSVLLGAAGGVFQPRVSYAVGTNPIAVALGDFNKDGKLDLAVVNQNCPQLPCA